LAERQAPSLQSTVDRVNKKSYELYIAFPSFPGKQQHFHIINRKLGYCFLWGKDFFKQNLQKVLELFVSPRNTRNFGAKTHLFYKLSLHIASLIVLQYLTQKISYLYRRSDLLEWMGCNSRFLL